MKFKPNDPKLTAFVWQLYGAIEILEELKGIGGPNAKLPGFTLALALAERTVADFRARLSTVALIAAAKAGADVGNSSGVTTSIEGHEVVLTVEPLDLADMMEG
jgi:hypothetical protein